MKSRTIRLLTMLSFLGAVGYSYAYCWIQHSTTCVPNGAWIDTVPMSGCQGVPDYTTHLFADGNWTWSNAYYLGAGSGWDTVQANVLPCCGTARAWNYCANSWSYFSNTCVATPGFQHTDVLCPQ